MNIPKLLISALQQHYPESASQPLFIHFSTDQVGPHQMNLHSRQCSMHLLDLPLWLSISFAIGVFVARSESCLLRTQTMQGELQQLRAYNTVSANPGVRWVKGMVEGGRLMPPCQRLCSLQARRRALRAGPSCSIMTPALQGAACSAASLEPLHDRALHGC